VKVRDLIEMLEAHGWEMHRQRGSHRQFKHASSINVITVAGQAGGDVPPGTLSKILRDAGLKKNLGRDDQEAQS